MSQYVVVDPGFGPYLRTLREERGWSLRRLGPLVNCSHGHLWDLEKGRKSPSLRVAALLDDALRAGGQLAAMVRPAAPDTLVDAPPIPATGGLDDVVHLWRSDLQRRDFLAASAFNAGAFLIPALRWLTAPAAGAPSSTGPTVVGMPDIEIVRQMLRVFRTADNQYGGGHVRDRLVRWLHHDLSELLQGRYDARTGAALMSAAAEATQMAGWASYDVGRHALAQQYMVRALQLASMAEDRPLGAEILAAMSHQAVYLRAGGEAVDLARAAARSAREAGVEAIVAEAEVLEAQGHAVLGDSPSAASALDRAERLFDRAERASDPQWLGYFDEAYLSAKFGQTFVALGRGDLALQFAERSLNMDERYARGRQFNLALVARSHAQLGQVEEAAAAAHQAADAAEGIDSARSRDYLAEIAERLAPHAGIEPVDAARARVQELVSA